MAIEIGPGWTIGGGISIVQPPSTPTAGWYAGGSNKSTIDRITFATDTATASVRGPLSSVRYQAAGAGTFTDGWIAGGGPTPPQSTIDRITYATDTATTSIRGPLSIGITALAGVSDNTTYGWFGGGNSPSNTFNISTIQRIVYSSDTSTATTRGQLSVGRILLSATGDTTYGWFGGGRAPSLTPTQVSIIDRITYATDTGTASVRGPLTVSVEKTGAIGTTIYGWFGGGTFGYPFDSSAVSRITYATDTATSSSRGPLSLARTVGVSTSGNDNYGWFGGGEANLSATSIIDRIDYATDTATATARGPLSVARVNIAGVSGIQ